MTLAPGTRFGPYEVVAPLGAGGMGEVYRARDTRLGRDVAVKVLPEAFARDPERLERFEREARVLASLQHPNVAAIYDLGTLGADHALVLELVEGVTLAERTARGPVPLLEAIAIARQITEALDAAHAKGVVHRDLKPGNIKISADGTVKVLDFGLARVLEGESAAMDPGALSQSPTLTGRMTAQGVILGTAGYMAPEQVVGMAADRRADLWAFGVVLWEMLAGRRLFDGETVPGTLTAVMHGELDWGALPSATPPALLRLLRRCLERDRKSRLRDAGDARVELDDALVELREGIARFATAKTAGRRGISVVLGLLLAVLGLAAGAVLGRQVWPRRPDAGAAGTPLRTTILLPDSVRLTGWASPVLEFSPDGTRLAFVGEKPGDLGHLYIHRLDTGETRLVPLSETAEGPFFSPDGQWVAFAVGASPGRGVVAPQLRKYSLESGLTQTLCNITDYFGGAWRDDGSILFANGLPDGLFQVPAGGGEPRQILAAFKWGGRDEPRPLAWPQLLPDGRSVLLTDWGVVPRRAVLVDLPTRELYDLGIEATYARYVPSTGHLVYLRPDLTLMAVAFDPVRHVARGEPVALLKNVTMSGNGAAALAISPDGLLTYTTGTLRGSLREPFRLVRLGPQGMRESLPVEPAEFDRVVRLSPDGTRAALATRDGALWVYDLERGTRRRLHERSAEFPSWSPDGRHLAFTETTSPVKILRVPAEGGAPPETLYRDPGEIHTGPFTPDGSKLLVWVFHPARRGLYTVPVGTRGGPSMVASGSAFNPAVSPDGRWLAYSGAESGRLQVVVRRMDGRGPAIPVSAGEGLEPRWARDGRELYYREGDDIMAVPVSGDQVPVVGTPGRIATLPDIRSYDVAPGKREFVVLQRVPGAGIQTRIQLVTHWFAELERRVPGAGGR